MKGCKESLRDLEDLTNGPTYALYSFLFLFLNLKNSVVFKDFIYLFLEWGKGGRKRGRETSMCGGHSCAPYTGNPGMLPDWKLNW